MPRLLLAPLCALLLAGPACDRRVEPYVPPEQEPPAPERPVRIPGGSRATPRVPELSSEAPAQGGAIAGRVALAAGVSPDPGGVLFVIARAPGGGPPLAVVRLPPGPFPLPFVLGPDDVMIPGRAFAGPITLTARLDADGDPLTRAEGDLAAELDAPVQPGAHGLELILR